MAIRELVLKSYWESLGATFKAENGWNMPAYFKGIEHEYEALRKGVGLIDASARGKIDVVGADRIPFLHRMLSNDIEKLKPGELCLSAFLNATGKVLAMMNVYCFTESLLMDVDIGTEQDFFPFMDKFILADQVKMVDITNAFAWFYLWGPHAKGLIEDLFYEDIEELEPNRFLTIPFGNINFCIMRNAIYPLGYTLYAHRDHAPRLAEYILQKGKGYEVQPVGQDAYEIVRIESGILKYGVDITDKIMLPETGLEELASSDNKGCYPGQEVVARTRTYGGLNQRITGLVFEKDVLPQPGDEIMKGDKKIGWITSSCISPRLGKGISLSYLKKPYFSKDTKANIKSSKAEGLSAKIPFVS